MKNIIDSIHPEHHGSIYVESQSDERYLAGPIISMMMLTDDDDDDDGGCGGDEVVVVVVVSMLMVMTRQFHQNATLNLKIT